MNADSIRLARGQKVEEMLEPLQGTEDFGILPGDGIAHIASPLNWLFEWQLSCDVWPGQTVE
jgi:hypothetical protein